LLKTITSENLTLLHLSAFTDLVRRTYGASYGASWIYDIDATMEKLRNKDIELVLIFQVNEANKTDTLFGSAMINFCYPSRALVNCGALMINPSVSTANAGATLKALTDGLTDLVMPLARTKGLRAMSVNAVTRHHLTQRLIKTIGFTTTGLLIGLVPANEETVPNAAADRTRKVDVSQMRSEIAPRMSEIMAVRPIRSFTKPYEVMIPVSMQHQINDVYTGLKLPVKITIDTGVSGTGETMTNTNFDIQRGQAMAEVISFGPDTTQQLLQLAEKWSETEAYEFQAITLPLIHGVGVVCKDLTDCGFQFGAVLPKYRDDHDVLILQRVNKSVSYLSAAQIYDEIAQRLYDDIYIEKTAPTQQSEMDIS
jgi:hypothetical protein